MPAGAFSASQCLQQQLSQTSFFPESHKNMLWDTETVSFSHTHKGCNCLSLSIIFCGKWTCCRRWGESHWSHLCSMVSRGGFFWAPFGNSFYRSIAKALLSWFLHTIGELKTVPWHLEIRAFYSPGLRMLMQMSLPSEQLGVLFKLSFKCDAAPTTLLAQLCSELRGCLRQM